jgi:hypothetical protein
MLLHGTLQRCDDVLLAAAFRVTNEQQVIRAMCVYFPHDTLTGSLKVVRMTHRHNT